MGTRLLTLLSALLFLPLPALAQVSIDPCEMQVAKQPFNATISSATVTNTIFRWLKQPHSKLGTTTCDVRTA